MRQFIKEFNMEPARGTPTINQYVVDNSHRRRIKNYGYWSNYILSDKIEYPNKGLAIVGDYENDCGGCDGITTKGKAQDEIQDRVRYFSKANHVLFEGLLISHIYGRYRDMAREYPPGEFLFALMNTPLAICKARINARREAKGKAPLEDHYNTVMMYEDVEKIARKCEADGLPYVWINYEQAFEHVKSLFGFPNEYNKP